MRDGRVKVGVSSNRVATDELQESIHGIRQQNPTWGSFEEALREAYDNERLTGRGRGEFKQWVASASIPRVGASFFPTLSAGTTIGGGG